MLSYDSFYFQVILSFGYFSQLNVSKISFSGEVYDQIEGGAKK